MLLVLAAAGCERSPATSSGAGPTTSDGIAEPRPAADAAAPAAATLPATTRPAPEAPRKFIAYYFHRTVRCPTCLSIEEQSREAIYLAYSGELSAGTLEWQAVNLEEPGNEHFEDNFGLQSQSLVLVLTVGEQVTRWKLLPKTWELVEDPHEFQEYVVSEVARFLGGG